MDCLGNRRGHGRGNRTTGRREPGFFFFKEEIPDVFGKINLIGTQFYLTLFLNSYATICDSSGLKPRARSHF